jgi:hypothetical protein
MSEWKPMSANPFPWDHEDVIVMAFARDEPSVVEIFRCTCAEHGAYFPKDGGLLSIIEQGWVPYAWRDDDAPPRDDARYPPMWTDYLTEPQRAP